MDKRKLLLGSLLVASVVSTPAMARSSVDVDINIGPPPPRVEVVPAPRQGYAWAPGYWRWNGQRHAWANGHWEREHHGRAWVQRGNRWYLERGHWG